jgi:ribonuclease HI
MRGCRGARVFQNSAVEEGTVKAVIVVFDHDLDIIQYPQLTTNNIVVVGIRTRAWTITLVSYYFEPDQPIGPYLDHLRKVEVIAGSKNLLIGGDANSKSTWWGSPNEDSRGEQMSGALEEMNLHILNDGHIPTFDTIRGQTRYSSYVDVTACTTDILGLVDDWRVEENLTSSDHNGILFEIKLRKSHGIIVKRTTRIFNTKKANWGQFHVKLTQFMQDRQLTLQTLETIQNSDEIDKTVNAYTEAITKTCQETIPSKKNTETITIPWWSEDLAEIKKQVATKKRRIRCAAPERRAYVVNLYLEEKLKYETAVKEAQINSWKEFCGRQDKENVWDGIYRVMGRTSKRVEDLPLEKEGRVLDARGSVELLADTFYPLDRVEDDNEDHSQTRWLAETVNAVSHAEIHDPPFTHDELKRATSSFNPKKAPGADGFTADICQQAINCDPKFFLALVNKSLAIQYFPKAWKEATVVVLRKPGKDSYKVPKSYRPIGLLPVIGKIFEKMMVARLRFYLLPKTSPRQYGFMPQRSTEDSLYTLMQHIRNKLNDKKILTLVSLDIEGAFDSAWWPAIKVRLAEEKCPVNLRRVMDSYLADRVVRVRYAGDEITRKTNKGCVQGSVGGPILWNLLLDPLLWQLTEQKVYCQAFADDVVLVFDGKTALEIEQQANTALAHVRAWGIKNKLKFAPHKTSAMVVTRKLKFDVPRLSMGGIEITMSREIKLLGLTIDAALTFNTHIANACKKALAMYKHLARTARVNWGLHPEVVRVIYTAVVEPTVLYAASAWAPAANKLGIRKQLNVVQRGFAQKLCRAYRTVSLHSALILAGLLPLDLRIREVASLYEVKKGVPHPALGGWEIERMVPAARAPHPSEQVTLDFGRLIDEEQYNRERNFDVRIFTDGSKMEGKVGAAISLWNSTGETKTLKLALPFFCTVYQAELLALNRAAAEVRKSKETTFGIFSDSMAALQTVTSCSPHPLAVETRDTIRDCIHQNKSVSLFWIKAHAGLGGNERADALAKEAALGSKKKPDYDLCPVSFLKRRIRMETIDEWDRRYRSGETGAVTKLFFPSAGAAYGVVREMGQCKFVTQLMTGHGGFSAYLHRFKCKDNPSCLCEPDKEETVPHVLFECPVFDRIRFDVEQDLGEKIVAESICKLMIGRNRDKLLKYCLEIVKKVVNRNK